MSSSPRKLSRIDDPDHQSSGADDNDDDDASTRTRAHHDDDADADYDIAQDVGRLFDRRRAYSGTVLGKKVCIGNLGWAFDEDQIRTELKQHLRGVEAIRFGTTVIENFSLHSGHGCIEFDCIENAVKGMLQLDNLYMDSPGLPVPRPILSHFPEWEVCERGEEDIAGYILDHGVSPHFCQPNTLEYDVALEWRLLQRGLSTSKKRLCDAFGKQLSAELSKVKYDIDVELLQSAYKDPSSIPARVRTLVCRGVSTQIRDEQIRTAIETADQCGNIRRVCCPVTGRETGTVFVETSSPLRAESVAVDMQRFLFILGRSPRPAIVGLAKFGPSCGFEGIFDRAVESVFGVKMHLIIRSKAAACHVVHIRAWNNEKGRCSERIREILNDMMEYRVKWKLESYEHQKDLEVRQKEWMDREMTKLQKLEKVVPQFFDENDL